MERLWARRRLVLGGTLAVLVAVLAIVLAPRLHSENHAVANRTSTATMPKPTATWRPTYSIIPDAPQQKAYHQGKQLAYSWDAQLDPAPRSYAPGAFTCTFALYGPYATEAGAQHAGDTDLSTAEPALTAPPLTLNRWTSQSQPEMLTLPANLPPGYYVAVGRVVESDAGSTGRTTTNAAIIQIIE